MDLLNNLRLDIQGFEWSLGEDVWRWNLEDGGVFTVSSMYKKLAEVTSDHNVWGEEECRVFGKVWKSPAPSRVVARSWKGLLDRLPTIVNLARRNALPPNVSSLCLLCNEVDESTNHLFLHCKVSWKIWVEVQHWLEAYLITPPESFSPLEVLGGIGNE